MNQRRFEVATGSKSLSISELPGNASVSLPNCDTLANKHLAIVAVDMDPAAVGTIGHTSHQARIDFRAQCQEDPRAFAPSSMNSAPENCRQYPSPPAIIYGDGITLRYSHLIPGNGRRGLVPAYHFRILDAFEVDSGHINFRVGDTEHITLVAGHIGYEIIPPQRGNSYAEKACRALAPFISRFYREVIITANPDNRISLHIIEKLGSIYVNEIIVPKSDPAYAAGARVKRRYRWRVA